MMDLGRAAAAAGVGYCRGIVNGAYCYAGDHQKGFVTDDGTVHFNRQRITHATLRKFCLLAAEAETGGMDYPDWGVRYLHCSSAERIAREKLHVRIPSRSWTLDRWKVRAQLAHVPTDHPLRAEALAWSRLGGNE